MDLTVGRIRQIAAAITERKLIEERKNRALLTWQTRVICTYVAAANPPEDGSENTLLDTVDKITLEPESVSNSEEKSDDISSERPVKYADTSSLALFGRAMAAGGPVKAG